MTKKKDTKFLLLKDCRNFMLLKMNFKIMFASSLQISSSSHAVVTCKHQVCINEVCKSIKSEVVSKQLLNMKLFCLQNCISPCLPIKDFYTTSSIVQCFIHKAIFKQFIIFFRITGTRYLYFRSQNSLTFTQIFLL